MEALLQIIDVYILHVVFHLIDRTIKFFVVLKNTAGRSGNIALTTNPPGRTVLTVTQ